MDSQLGFLQIHFKELQFLDSHSRLLRDTFLKKNQFERISRYHCYDKTQGMTTVISLLYWARRNHDVNDILNYRTNYQLRKCRKQDCSSTGVLIVTFHEIVTKYDSELKTQLVLSNISTNHNVKSPRSLHSKFCQMIYLFKTFLML